MLLLLLLVVVVVVKMVGDFIGGVSPFHGTS